MHNESIFWPSCNMQLPRALTSVRMRHNIFSRRLALSTSNFDKNFEESSSDSYENMKKIWVVCKHTCVWCLLIAINLNCVNIIKFIIYLSRRCFFLGKILKNTGKKKYYQLLWRTCNFIFSLKNYYQTGRLSNITIIYLKPYRLLNKLTKYSVVFRIMLS